MFSPSTFSLLMFSHSMFSLLIFSLSTLNSWINLGLAFHCRGRFGRLSDSKPRLRVSNLVSLPTSHHCSLKKPPLHLKRHYCSFWATTAPYSRKMSTAAPDSRKLSPTSCSGMHPEAILPDPVFNKILDSGPVLHVWVSLFLKPKEFRKFLKRKPVYATLYPYKVLVIFNTNKTSDNFMPLKHLIQMPSPEVPLMQKFHESSHHVHVCVQLNLTWENNTSMLQKKVYDEFTDEKYGKIDG
jgi:hypothetical protein